MKRLIAAAIVFHGSVHAQTLDLSSPLEPSPSDFWEERPREIQVDLGELKIGPGGYRFESTDFDEDPNRQLVVILERNGASFDIVEIRGRYSTQKELEEWSVYYLRGSPVLAQVKKWQKLSTGGEELGEALLKVGTFLAQDGEFAIDDKDWMERIVDMTAFADKMQAEQVAE